MCWREQDLCVTSPCDVREYVCIHSCKACCCIVLFEEKIKKRALIEETLNDGRRVRVVLPIPSETYVPYLTVDFFSCII